MPAADQQHVVVVPLPVDGHLNPLLQLSVKMVESMAVTVSFVTPRWKIDSISQRLPPGDDHYAVRDKITLVPLEHDHDDSLQAGGDGGIWANLWFMAAHIDQLLRLVEISAQERGPVCCVILDLLLMRSLSPSLRNREIRIVSFWTASAAFLLVSMHLRKIVDHGYAPLKADSGSDDLRISSSFIPGIPELRVRRDLPYTFQLPPAADPCLEQLRKFREIVLGTDCVLINTFQELEDEALRGIEENGVQALAVGPLFLRPRIEIPVANDPSDEIFRWLSSNPESSILYVSFGSMKAMTNTAQLRELAYGLEESGHPYLWIVPSELQPLLPHRFFQSTSTSMIRSWCPQLQVLNHPSTAAFLSHGGWNSTIESIAAGVPILGWPCMADQNLNCKYLEDVWEIGCRIHSDPKQQDQPLVARSRIGAAVRWIMSRDREQDVRKHTAAWKGAAARAADGSSARNIRKIVVAP